MKIKLLYLFSGLLLTFNSLAQTFGANSPGTTANNTAVGANAWTGTGSITASDNVYASVTAKGITNYASATNFAFSLPVTTNVNGIMVEVEKSTLSPTVVTVLDNWTNSWTRSISSGGSRCLVAVVSTENGQGSRDVTALTYGGQAMTQYTDGVVGTSGGFQGRVEIWYLLNAGITAATNTSFSPTYSGVTLQENAEILCSAVYAGVDQNVPFSGASVYTVNAATNPITHGSALATTAGGLAVSVAHCGNNTTPGASIGGTNTYLINSSFTEVIDTYTANSGFTGSGFCLQVCNKSIASVGSEAPTYTFNGTPNRQIAALMNLQCIREIDNSVRLIKGGTITGNNLAQTNVAWLTTDSYISYGSSSNLWGTTWLYSDINANNFGAVVSASVSNGTARIDHIRITVTGVSTLPVKLIDFTASGAADYSMLKWYTATEHNSREFVIERSDASGAFHPIGATPGKGNSMVLNTYEFDDHTIGQGLWYYRLKQIDHDGSYTYSKIISVTIDGTSGQSSLFPNPTAGEFVVKADDADNSPVKIYSGDMRLLKSIDGALDDTSFKISINELPDGIYYVVFRSGGEEKIRQVIKMCRQ